ncbi:MAG TPA: hypothetical protein VEI96_10340 [Thermodesulfovibrionales bacterium]|nr:hypothetical protein [Thermodesulfovibrionales bacterium]
MKRTFITVLLLVGVLMLSHDVLPARGASAPTLSDEDIQMLRKDLRSEKKQVVAQNMQLTDAEAEKFWPVYDDYTAETIKINDSKFAIIKKYMEGNKSLTDAEALKLIDSWLEVDEAAAKLRQKFIPIFEKILPAKKVVRFLQIDRRLGLILDLQIASQLPLSE